MVNELRDKEMKLFYVNMIMMWIYLGILIIFNSYLDLKGVIVLGIGIVICYLSMINQSLNSIWIAIKGK